MAGHVVLIVDGDHDGVVGDMCVSFTCLPASVDCGIFLNERARAEFKTATSALDFWLMLGDTISERNGRDPSGCGSYGTQLTATGCRQRRRHLSGCNRCSTRFRAGR